MFAKHHLFIIVAILFVFTYPAVVGSWSLNDSIGWGFRPLKTYLIPLWFIVILRTYQRLGKKKIAVSNLFFWYHLLVSAVPVFFINFPFARLLFFQGHTMEEQFSSMYRIRNWVYLYFLLQLLFYCLLVRKDFLQGRNQQDKRLKSPA